MRRSLIPYVLLLAGISLSCQEHIEDVPAGNQQPRTYLWLYPQEEIRMVPSRQRLYWWGEDPDGLIRGYLFAFRVVEKPTTSVPVPADTQRYVWTSANDTTILFPLDTLFRRFAVTVRSVDNSFSGTPDTGAVRLFPTPYWDKNDNGVFDGGDVGLPDLTQAMDPAGSVVTFPIRNSPPSISFVLNPNDQTTPLRQPDTTFTAATFSFKGTDPDGDNTLVSYRIAINDTSNPANWLTLSLRDTIVTLTVPRSRSNTAGSSVSADVYSGKFLGRRLVGTLPGLRLDALNTFYVQVQDVAGEFSRVLVMPSGTDRWYVRRPRARLLLVSDYVNTDASTALGTYLTSLASVPGGEFSAVDRLNIGLGVTLSDKAAGRAGVLVPAFVDPALVYTFLLYDYVFWYTDQQPSLGVAQLSLFTYLQNGGRVLFSTSFVNTIDPRGALRDFAPIDSISSVDLSPTRPPVPPAVAGDTRIPASFVLYADSASPAQIYPQLAFNSTPVNHVIFMRPVYRRSDARYLYRLQDDTRVPGRYLGSPNVAVVDGQNTIIFVGLPLHLLNNTVEGNPRGLTAFFEKTLQQFSPSQVVNRAKF
jgi:hypothetical protein